MEDLLAKAEEIDIPKPGTLVQGKVINTSKNSALVDLCDGAMVGIVKGREVHDSAGTFKKLNPGDDIAAVVVEDENEEGFLVLSLRKAAQNLAWDNLLEMYDEGDSFEIRVTEANKGGLMTEIDSIKAFIPVSQLAPMHYPRVNNANSTEILKRLERLIGERLIVKVIAIDQENGKLILSEKFAIEEQRQNSMKGLSVGQKVKGRISGIVKFGIFVAFEGIEGLVHISEIAWGHVNNPADYGKIGDDVEILVIGIDGEKISLSMKRLIPDPWVEAAKKYKVSNTITGKITRIASFGAFVGLENEINGLIHLSEISHQKVEDIEKFIKVGQEVAAKIINVDLDEHRIGLSLKALQEPPPEQEKKEEPVKKIETKGEKKEEKVDKAKKPKAKKEEKKPAKAKKKETSKKSEDLTELDGVTKKIAESLKKAGYKTPADLKKVKLEDLTSLDGIGEKTAQKILDSVK